MDLNPSHFGSYDASGGIPDTDLASMGETGGITGNCTAPMLPAVGVRDWDAEEMNANPTGEDTAPDPRLHVRDAGIVTGTTPDALAAVAGLCPVFRVERA
jgi:hypothetical protein